MHPVVGEHDALEVHRAQVRADRGLGQHRHAHPVGHHQAHRVEAAHLDAHAQPAAEEFGLLVQAARQRRGAGQAHEVVVHHVGERDLLAALQRMALGHHQHEAVAPVVQHVEAVRGGAVGEDPEVGAAVQHGHHDVAAVLLLELDADAGIAGLERGQFGRQELRQRRGVGPQPHDAHDAGRVVRQLRRQLLDLLQHRARALEQHLSGGGGPHAARVALQQRDADGGLEVGDALARRADRQVGERGALADAARSNDQREQRQRGQV